MKLHKLHVFKDGPGPKRHRHPVPSRIRRVGRPGIDLARATCRQDDGRGSEDLSNTGHFVEHERSAADAIDHDKVHGKVMTEPLDPLVSPCLGHQDLDHFIAGRIAPGAQNTTAAVRRLLGEGELPADLVKLGSPGNQFLDSVRPLLDQNLDRLLPTKAAPGIQRISQMDGNIVLLAQRDRDSPLSIARTAFKRVPLGQNQHPTMSAQLDRGSKTRDAAPDHQEILLRPAHLARGSPTAVHRTTPGRGVDGTV